MKYKAKLHKHIEWNLTVEAKTPAAAKRKIGAIGFTADASQKHCVTRNDCNGWELISLEPVPEEEEAEAAE